MYWEYLWFLVSHYSCISSYVKIIDSQTKRNRFPQYAPSLVLLTREMSLFTSSINLPKRLRDGPRTWNCQQASDSLGCTYFTWVGSQGICTYKLIKCWLTCCLLLTVLVVINNIYDRFRPVVCPWVDEHTLWPCNLIFLQYRVRIHNTFTCFHQCIPQTIYFDCYIAAGTRKPQFSLYYSSYSALQKPPMFHSPVKATSTEMHESLAAWGHVRVGKEALRQPLKSPAWEFEITWQFLQKQIKEWLRLLYETRCGARGIASSHICCTSLTFCAGLLIPCCVLHILLHFTPCGVCMLLHLHQSLQMFEFWCVQSPCLCVTFKGIFWLEMG